MTKKKYAITFIILLLGVVLTALLYQNYLEGKKTEAQQAEIERCNKTIEEKGEIEYSVNQIAYYLRHVRSQKDELTRYKDSLYRQAKEIERDLYRSRTNPEAVCVPAYADYNDLYKSLEYCEKNLREVYDSALKNSISCLKKRAARQAANLAKSFKSISQ